MTKAKIAVFLACGLMITTISSASAEQTLKFLLPASKVQPAIVAKCHDGVDVGELKSSIEQSVENEGKGFLDIVKAELEVKGCKEVYIYIEEKKENPKQ